MTVHRSENVVALPSSRGFEEDAGKAPDHSEEGAEHEMGSIHEEDLSFAGCGLGEPGQHLGLVEVQLHLGISLAGYRGHLTKRHPKSFHGASDLALT